MSKIYKILLAILIVSTLSLNVSAQDYWSARTAGTVTATDKAVARQSFPTEFKLFALNVDPLRQQLFSIVGDNAARRSAIISIPNADGGFEQFEVTEASNFEPELQARFPEIRAFSGKGITDRSATLKLSISPQGIQTMVFRTAKNNEFIEPYSQDHTVYAVFKSKRAAGQLPWACSTQDQQIDAGLRNQLGQINNTTDVFYYNPVTDPYSAAGAGAGGAWNGELQTTLTSVIGDANYDIGHIFGASGGGGNAGCIGCVCVDGQKGRGFTSPADNIPQGDNFDIDYVAHEVGHQMGGNHTFSMSNEGTGVNKEVGSGITIMGYAGITGQDVAPHSIDIFHETSIDQIQVNMAGKTCPVTTSLTGVNATPTVTPGVNWTIPISTPFSLTGAAADADAGDVLTYCWEQNDDGTGFTGNNSVAFVTKTGGPNWLSFSPTTNPTRLFPKLSTILAGLSVTPTLPGGDAVANIEALSSIGRTLNFRLTVRDNRAYNGTAVGQTAFTNSVITVSAAVGPFLISSQNAAVSYDAGTTQTVTWSVNGTTGAPTNTANVKISWSTDGGNTFPTVLAASTPNDGSETFIVPATLTTQGRIKVEAVGNVYFDINNANVTVTTPPVGFSLGTTSPATSACPAGATMTVTLPVISNGGYVQPVTLSATAGVPAGTTITFGTNPVTPGNSSTVVLNNANTLAAGSYVVTIQGTGALPGVTQTTTVTYTVNAGAGPAIGTQPVATAACVGANTSFSVVSATATGYQWQVSTNGGVSYSNVGGGTAATLNLTNVQLSNAGLYQVIVTGQCGTTTSAAVALTVNVAPAVTSNPANFSTCSGNNATFTVAGTGSGLSYQWQGKHQRWWFIY
ncbi:MAG: peptidase [Chitinophagaceae bacterium]|nr:peptidase [Chitinophagaceae bacterium]